MTFSRYSTASSVTYSSEPGRGLTGCWCVLIAAVLLSGCSSTSASEDGIPLFSQHSIKTGSARHQTVLTGYFFDNEYADIAVTNVDDSNHRYLTMISNEGDTWRPVLETELGSDVTFIDVGNIGARDRLLTYATGLFSWFDPLSGSHTPLIQFPSDIYVPETSTIPHYDVTHDLNLDGRDDLIMPNPAGFYVSIQNQDGTFTDPVQLGSPDPLLDKPGIVGPGLDEVRSNREIGITPLTLPLYFARVHQVDYNLDKRSDLMFWNRDHFDVYLQNDQGLFETKPIVAKTSVQFDSEGGHTRIYDFTDEGIFSLVFGWNRNSHRTVLDSLRDMDGDGVTDLITLTLYGRSGLRQRSVYKVHYGTLSNEGIEFSSDAGAVIKPRGKAGAGQPWGYAFRWFEDIDGDGDIDVLFKDVNIGLGGMARALLTRSIRVDIECYVMNDGVYSNQPDFAHSIRTGSRSTGQASLSFPAVMLGDVSGDGLADLVTGQQDEWHVYLTTAAVTKPFAGSTHLIESALPGQGENARLVNLNRDRKRDVLVPVVFENNQHGVVLLIAN